MPLCILNVQLVQEILHISEREITEVAEPVTVDVLSLCEKWVHNLKDLLKEVGLAIAELLCWLLRVELLLIVCHRRSGKQVVQPAKERVKVDALGGHVSNSCVSKAILSHLGSSTLRLRLLLLLLLLLRLRSRGRRSA